MHREKKGPILRYKYLIHTRLQKISNTKAPQMKNKMQQTAFTFAVYNQIILSKDRWFKKEWGDTFMK